MRVVFTQRAADEFEAAADWWAAHRSLNQAVRWYEGFNEAIELLAESAEQWPLARENHLYPYEIRELHFGLGPHPTHRAVFTIRPGIVLILTIRHVSQSNLTEDDLP